MRFIHTGDWHLGRLFHNVHLTEDQGFTLDGLLRLAEEVRAEAVVVAGDVFDRAVPPTQAVELLDQVLGRLALELRIPVVMIAGNHDSPVRLQYLSGVVSRVGVHVVGQVDAEPRGVNLSDADGQEIVFWPLAYTDPETARCVLGRDDIHTHEAAIVAQIAALRERMSPGARHVLVGHAFVTGSKASESERPLTVGGTGEVSHEVFEGFDYVALGHLHRPQNVSDRVRYAGSLLKYSFDEADDRKTVSVVDLAADGAVTVEQHQLPVRRDLVRLRGSLGELTDDPHADWYREAYLEVTLTDTDTVLDPMERLRAVYPHILSLRREAAAALEVEGGRRPVRGRTTEDLFAEFFDDVTGSPLNDAQHGEVAAALAEVERQRREVEQ